MSTFSTKRRIGIDGTEAWVVSADHFSNVLDLVFKNRRGEIWLFNNDLLLFKDPDLFKSVYIEKVVGALGSRISAVKVFVEDGHTADEVFDTDCPWLQERFKELSTFISIKELEVFPRFLFGRTSELKKHPDHEHLFKEKGIPPHHTWVFYLHGGSLSREKQYGIVMFRPTEFPFASNQDHMGISWHLSDQRILTRQHLSEFDSMFHTSIFKQFFPGDAFQHKVEKPTENDDGLPEGIAFGEPTDILVLAPADDEMSCLRKMIGDRLCDVTAPGALNCSCFVTEQKRTAILVKLGEGNIGAGPTTSRLLDLFRPKQVILLGVAGAIVRRGRHEWTVGDIIIGQSVIYYEWGDVVDSRFSWRFNPKSDNETEWGGEDYDRFIYQKAHQFANDGWELTPDKYKEILPLVCKAKDVPHVENVVEEYIRRPSSAHIGLIGSGDKVIASRRYVRGIVDKKSAKINALETEAAGVAYACKHAEGKVDFVIIRGIMDLADGKTRQDKVRKGFRHIANIACGRFVLDFLDKL